jgi:hypothetical protein
VDEIPEAITSQPTKAEHEVRLWCVWGGGGVVCGVVGGVMCDVVGADVVRSFIAPKRKYCYCYLGHFKSSAHCTLSL